MHVACECHLLIMCTTFVFGDDQHIGSRSIY